MQCTDVSAIVTGGGSGLGAASARRLHAAGAVVTILDRDLDAGAMVADEPGSGATFIATDVTDVQQVDDAVRQASGTAPLRIVVNCAGIGLGARTIGRDGVPADIGDFTRIVTVNLTGTYIVATRAAAAMARTDELAHGERGVIVNTASIAAFDGQIGQTAYAASKGGIVGLTLPMARDLSSVGIRVNTIAPGIVDTPLLAGLDGDMRAALAAGVPFPKRLGTPEDYADLMMAVVGNGYVNGETIRMDGALRMPPR
ncbi:MAG: SDR family NAD(P)-dependent oxidoreductase [Acidimicrobiia bacterium]|nr:SDR family NAD(P)-dependent oxidoreductase [Acidimicrobiia bacterium]